MKKKITIILTTLLLRGGKDHVHGLEQYRTYPHPDPSAAGAGHL